MACLTALRCIVYLGVPHCPEVYIVYLGVPHCPEVYIVYLGVPHCPEVYSLPWRASLP